MYDDRRTAIHRSRRLPDDYRAIVANQLMSPAAGHLLLALLDLPPTWQITVTYVVKLTRYGSRDVVRRLFREMMLAGHMCADPIRRPDGTFERGIYLVASDARWLGGAVDNLGGGKTAISGGIGASHGDGPASEITSPGIDNSIDNPDTDTSREAVNFGVTCQPQNAEARQSGLKSSPTNKTEPRSGAASHLPKAERRTSAAKGSAGQKPGSARGKKSSGDTSGILNIEHTRSQLVAASGRALADARATPGLWRLTEVIVWLTLGYDLAADILPTIRDVSTRIGIEPGQVRSWRYYSAAIRDAHARRLGLDVPHTPAKHAPRLDPYAAAPRDPGVWQAVGLAAFTPADRGR
jgi:hypothetical protein